MRSIENKRSIVSYTEWVVNGLYIPIQEKPSLTNSPKPELETPQNIEDWLKHNITPPRIIGIMTFINVGLLTLRAVNNFLKRRGQL